MKYLKPLYPLFQATALALLLGVATTGCDEVNGPYKDLPPVSQGPDTTGTDTTGTDTTGTDTTGTDTTGTTVAVRKVLLEEFTGHQCGNCPEGAELAHQLKDLYGDRLIIMSVHAGFFAQVKPSGKYTYDFRTPAGNAIDAEYGVTAYPSAIINRTNQRVFGKTEWATAIDTILSRPPQAKINIAPTLTESNRELKLNVTTTFVEPVSKPQNLTVYLVEYGKTDWQKDYRLPNGQQDIENYSHDHFLRATLTSTWGNVLTTGPVAANQSVSKSFTYQIPAGFNIDKLKVIAVVNDPVNYYIMQAEETGFLKP